MVWIFGDAAGIVNKGWPRATGGDAYRLMKSILWSLSAIECWHGKIPGSLAMAGVNMAESDPGAAEMSRFVKSGEIGDLRSALVLGADPDKLLADPLARAMRTPLMVAVEAGNWAAFEILAPLSDPSICDAAGNAALEYAALSLTCPAGMLARLLESGDPMRIGGRGRTALMFAAMSGNVEKVSLLLPSSDPWAKDDDGCSALDHARDTGRFLTGSLDASQVLERWFEGRELDSVARRPDSTTRRDRSL